MKTLLWCMLLTMLLAGSAFGECSDGDKKALEAFDKSWGMANWHRDVEKLKTIYSDDFRAFPGLNTKANVIAGAEADAAANKDNPRTGEPDTTWDRYIISCTANTATITHRNIFVDNDGPGGREMVHWTRSIHFLEKRGGNWQLVSTTGHEMDDQMMLYYMDQDWTDANGRRDREWYEKNFADDFSSVSSEDGRIFSKKEDIEDTMNSKATIISTSSRPNLIKVDRNYGTVTGTYHFVGKGEDGATIDERYRYTDTYIKRDGRWQVWSTISVRMPDE